MKKSQNRSYVLQGCFRLLALVLAILPYRPAHAYESNKVQQLIRRAVKGDGEAKLELGRIYAQNGELSEAFKWFKSAAEQGLGEGQEALGYAFTEGVGNATDEAEGLMWFRRAVATYTSGAESGDTKAQLKLADMYWMGTGVAGNKNEAIKWCTKAAQQGSVSGQGQLGAYYLGSDLSEKERCDNALEWFRLAAEKGDAMAQANLGTLYDAGSCVTKDYQEALRWLRKAADQGNAQAIHNIGVMYRDGHGVPQDEKIAGEWFKKAEMILK